MIRRRQRIEGDSVVRLARERFIGWQSAPDILRLCSKKGGSSGRVRVAVRQSSLVIRASTYLSTLSHLHMIMRGSLAYYPLLYVVECVDLLWLALGPLGQMTSKFVS